MSALADQVLNVVNACLSREGVVRQWAPEESLRERGVTSLQLVSLIFELERSFGISIPGEALTQKNFDSVGAIARTLGKLRGD